MNRNSLGWDLRKILNEKKTYVKTGFRKKGCVEVLNQNTIQNAPFIFHIIVIFTIHISFDSFVFFNLWKSFTYHSKRNVEEQEGEGDLATAAAAASTVRNLCNVTPNKLNEMIYLCSTLKCMGEKNTETINILISCCVLTDNYVVWCTDLLLHLDSSSYCVRVRSDTKIFKQRNDSVSLSSLATITWMNEIEFTFFPFDGKRWSENEMEIES